MKKIRPLFAIIIILIASSSFANTADANDFSKVQYTQPLFKNMEIDNPIFSGRVAKIVQDTNGFIWLAGTKGLARFDGYKLIKFNHQPNDNFSIIKDSIRTITPDHNGGIWIAYNNSGLGHYNANTEKFTHYPHITSDKNSPSSNTIRDIVIKQNGDLWIGTSKGLDHFSIQTKQFSHYTSGSNKRHANWIFDLTLDSSEKLWIATAYGIKVLDKEQAKFTHPSLYDKSNNLLSSKQLKLTFSASMLASDGRIWLIGQKNKIYVIDPKTSQRVKIDTQFSPKDAIYSQISQVDNQYIWISNYRKGIEVFDLHTLERKYHIPANKYQKLGLENGLVTDIMTDNNGNTWISYRNQKPKFTNQNLTAFQYINTEFNKQQVYFEKQISDILALDNTKHLVLSKNQILLINAKTGTEDTYTPTNSQNYIFKSMSQGKNGDIWIITKNGTVISFNLKTKKFINHAVSPKMVPGHQFHGILYISNNELLISTNSGAITFNPENKKFTQLLAENQKAISAFIWSSVKTKNEHYFLAANNGLYYKLAKQNSFKYIANNGKAFDGAQVKKIIIDNSDKVWMFTDRHTYQIQLNQTQLSFIPISKYKNNYLRASTPIIDHQDNIWMSPYLYYSQAKKQYIELAHYNINELIRLDSSPKIVSTPYFWTSDKILKIQSKLLSKSKIINPIKIVELNINNEKRLLSPNQNLILDAQNQQLNLQFSALDHFYADQISYQFKLDGLDETWQHSPNTERRAVYSSLAPGNYQLRVKASLNEHIETAQELKIKIKVLPKIYQTFWFKLVVFATLLFTLFNLHKFFLNKKLLTEQRLNEHKIAKEKSKFLEELIVKKNQMLADVSHELSTPLTVLKLQVESLQDNLEENVQDTYNSLNQKLNDIQQLIDGISQLAQSDVGALQLNKTPFKFHQILTDWEKELTKFVNTNKLTLTIDKNIPEDLVVNFDKNKIKQIFINLLTNSIKYTSKPGQVKLSASEKNNRLFLTIEDSAPGVSDKDLTSIFERLYRVESSRSRETGGSGLGLAICKSLIKEHNGVIFAEHSQLGGLKIIMELPLVKA